MSIPHVDKLVIFIIVTGVLIILGTPSELAGLVGAACAFGKFIVKVVI